MDFFRFEMQTREKETWLAPGFVVGKSKDIMFRGGKFYAVWDPHLNIWNQDESAVVRLVDEALRNHAKEQGIERVRYMESYSSGVWRQFKAFSREMIDTHVALDQRVLFADHEIQRSDYASFKLDYTCQEGSTDAWDELVSTLYSPSEQAKIEWAIGSIVEGDSKVLQKFFVFYGPPGSGKSTILNIITSMFERYTVTFDSKALGQGKDFSMASFASGPLLGIQQDGDLSKIVDNTQLNSVVSHDTILINEKYAKAFAARLSTLLFIGTNQPVKITDANSGIIRRLIDINPTGQLLEFDVYMRLINRVKFEFGAIAWKCHQRYLEMGRKAYDGYRPLDMMYRTNAFFNFVEYHYPTFKSQNSTTLKQAWALFKEWCEETGVTSRLAQYEFRDELKNYFEEFHVRAKVDGEEYRSYFKGFTFKPQNLRTTDPKSADYVIELTQVEDGVHTSIFDTVYAGQPAQYATEEGTPTLKWVNVRTNLVELDTSRLHYVQVPENHIVIDFDLTDETGAKSLVKNLEAASEWPPTYTELSKSGLGVHLHYTYDGDVEHLANVYKPGIEIKTLLGNSSLRRKLTKCNNRAIAPLTGALPRKEHRVLTEKVVQSERALRELIARNLRKEIHPGTRPSVKFIQTILDEAYAAGLVYDVTDMRPTILAFAAKSTNHKLECINCVQQMLFKGKEATQEPPDEEGKPLVFFDVEVYPNLFVVCWKRADKDGVNVMINPGADLIEPLFTKYRLVGFNNRRYDNHILYARFLGYTLEELFMLSQDIINNVASRLFGEAFDLSYADVYDFSSKKQGLKKFMVELGIKHVQIDIPWDQPVHDEATKKRIIEYCMNDVDATQKVFEARYQDFVARKILADLSGLSINHTTQQHTQKIIFGDDKRPKDRFVYTDLSKHFPGYRFENNQSTYRGEIVGEGGYVYAEPGVYENVTVLDVASMHPTSIEILNVFGPYTEKFSALKQARLAIKHKEFDAAKTLLDGKLAPYLGDEKDAEALSYALKIVINIVYGLTSSTFDSAFRDYRNKDNIVAKRGALFMIDLKHAVQERGFQVVHIKTDSIKIPDATPEIVEFVYEFGRKYGYEFELEGVYEKFCLVNDAVYVAKEKGEWTAVGAQFKHPYVFKKMFSDEPITFDDLTELKQVKQGMMYLDLAEDSPVSDMSFVGNVGRFVPVEENGGTLWRVTSDGKKYGVTGTKGWRWMRADVADTLDKEGRLRVDMSYFKRLWMKAREAIESVGSIDQLFN
jgi:energy-coupling factor transporter ATP-binding protein EcfA2